MGSILGPGAPGWADPRPGPAQRLVADLYFRTDSVANTMVIPAAHARAIQGSFPGRARCRAPAPRR